jgi:hypothetical protein
MRRHARFIVASLLSLPSLVTFLLYLFMLCLRTLQVSPSKSFEHLFISLLFGLVAIPMQFPIFALPLFAIVLFAIAAAWLQKAKSRFEIVATGVCALVVLLHVVFVIWGYVAGWTWDL